MSQVLEAQTGRERGSRPSGRLRREGIVPGVLYGMGMEPISLQVEWPALRRALNADGGLAAPIRLKVAGKEHLTLVKELQRHPVRRDVIHVDFLAVDPDEPVTVEVALVLSGVEDLSASLHDKVVLLVHRLEVTAKPGAIPAELAIDVSGLSEGAELRVRDLPLPAGVVTDTDPDTVLVTAGGEGALAVGAPEGAAEGESEGEQAAADGEGDAAEGSDEG
ncbi:MAG: 50S ribosomal protein L25 [Acidimicrobiales bacterium]